MLFLLCVQAFNFKFSDGKISALLSLYAVMLIWEGLDLSGRQAVCMFHVRRKL